MNVRKFVAGTAREALRQVRESLGPDALILSNTTTPGGIELLAMPGHAVSALAPEAPPRPRASAESAPRADPRPDSPSLEEMLSRTVREEVRAMRILVEQQFEKLAWSEVERREPAKAGLLRELLDAGFSPALSRKLVEKLPAGHAAGRAHEWAEAVLVHNLQVLADEDQLIGRGGVYALMGPTGVGKTTTTAKLAARCVVRHGAERLALVTTDSYRIGAREQLRIYAKLLGVTVHAVKDTEDLGRTLEALSGKHMVLIDTIGMSQRDRMVAEQLAMLSGCGVEVKRLLLLNATCNGETLEDVVCSYRGAGLAGCILTKEDEAANLGAAIDVMLRHRLKLHYVANGQRVPEDLHPADRVRLVRRAFAPTDREAPCALERGDFPLVMAGGRRPGAAAGAGLG